MKGGPLVSAVLPAYNHELYVQEALRSLIAQTYDNIELILIDDGSRDATLQKIEQLRAECEGRFVRTVIRTQPNAGTCETLNRLLAEAQGEYVYMLASDDAAMPHAIEAELEFLQQHPDYVLAVGDNAIMNGRSERIGWDAGKKSYPWECAPYKTMGELLFKVYRDIDFHLDQFGSYLSLMRGQHVPNGYLIRASALKAMGGFTKEAPLEDYYLMLQLAKQGKMKYLDDILYSYRWHDTNTMTNTERICRMEEKTVLYEQELVNKLGSPWKEWFAEGKTRVKIKLRLGSALCFKKITTPRKVEKVLEIFGRRFTLGSRNR